MPQDNTDRKMPDDEWWDGLDREFGHVLVGTTRLQAAGFILSAVFILTALLVYAR